MPLPTAEVAATAAALMPGAWSTNEPSGRASATGVEAVMSIMPLSLAGSCRWQGVLTLHEL